MPAISLPKLLNKSTAEKAVAGKDVISTKDFIPYSAYVDGDTILTKNGELLQTLKIIGNQAGLPTEDAAATGVYLRDAIREALRQHITTPDISVWMHVFRNQTPLAPLATPPESFAAEVQKEWLDKQRAGYSYYNECYVTLLVEGQSAELWNLADFKRGFRVSSNRAFREAYLQQAHAKLSDTVQQIQHSLASTFQVSRLGMVERASAHHGAPHAVGFYSEQLEFLHRVMNLDAGAMPVSKKDLSAQLATHEMIFGFDAIETRQHKKKRFASLVSLKHYHELPPEVLDRFLQMPMEMIVTQTYDYVSAKTAFAEVDDVRNVLKKSKDDYVAHASGFVDVLQAMHDSPVDFIEQQTTIMLMTDHYGELDEMTTQLQTNIARMGLVSVREDIKFEECFWSQLPGNFEFIRRKHTLPAARAFGLARLNYYPTGRAQSHWGEPITILPTVTKTPYQFHFHEGVSGHTALIDFNSFPDALGYRLVHFLAAAASKQTSRIIMFDRHASAEMFTHAMHGRYLHLGGQDHNLGLNPCAMPQIPKNQNFMAAWLALILDIDPGHQAHRQAIKNAVAHGWQGTQTDQLAAIAASLAAENSELASRLTRFLARPVSSRTLQATPDNFALDAALTTINIHKSCVTEKSHIALFALMLHRVILSLDNRPTLIILKEGLEVLDHPFFASRLESLLEMLSEHNTALMVTTRDIERLGRSPLTPELMRLTPTKIFLPDDVADDYMRDIVGLSEAEDVTLLRMERQKGDMLVKHGMETIPTRFKVDNPKHHAILTGDAKTHHGMRAG